MGAGFGVVFVLAFPAVEVFEAGGEGAVLRVVAIADDHEGVPVEQVGDGVAVVGVVLFVGAVDVDFEAFEFDEHQGQAVDEADQIGPAQMQGAAHPQFTHGEEAVAFGSVEVDQAQAFIDEFAGVVAEFDGHAIAQQLVFFGVVLDEGLGGVGLEDGAEGLGVGGVGEAGVEASQGGDDVAGEDDLGIGGASEQALGDERAFVLGHDAVPAEVGQKFSGGGLDERVFGVFVFLAHGFSLFFVRAAGYVHLFGLSWAGFLRSVEEKLDFDGFEWEFDATGFCPVHDASGHEGGQVGVNAFDISVDSASGFSD